MQSTEEDHTQPWTSTQSYQAAFQQLGHQSFYSPRTVSDNISVGVEVPHTAGMLDRNFTDSMGLDFQPSAFQNLSIHQVGPDMNGYHSGIMAPNATALTTPHHNHSDSGVSLPPYGDNLHLQSRVPPALSWGPFTEIAPGPTPIPSQQAPKPQVEIRVESDTLKTRAEKQVNMTLTFKNLPPHYVNIHFPRSSMTKPKYLAPRSEVESLKKQGKTLHLTMYCVSYTWVKKNGLELPMARARNEVPNVRRDPGTDIDQLKKDDDTHPRQGAELVICRKCKERERKRLGRVKEGVKEVKDYGEWAKYEDDHFVMVNEQEIKGLSAEPGSVLRPGQLATKSIKFRLRFACYCRHQDEPPTGGYKCIFTLWDYSTMEVLGQEVTGAFSITDDHKTRETMDYPPEDTVVAPSSGWKTHNHVSSVSAAFSQPPTPTGVSFSAANGIATNFFGTLPEKPPILAQASTPGAIYPGQSLPPNMVSSEPATPIRQHSRPQSRGQFPQMNLANIHNGLNSGAAQPGSQPPADFVFTSGPPLPHYQKSEQLSPYGHPLGSAATNWQPTIDFQPQQVNNFTSPVEQPAAGYQSQQVGILANLTEQPATYSGHLVATSAASPYVKEEPNSPTHPPNLQSHLQQLSPSELATPGSATFYDNGLDCFSSQASSQAGSALPSRAQSMTDFSKMFNGKRDTWGDWGNYPSAPATAVHTPRFTLSRPPSPSFPHQPHIKRQRQAF